MLKKILCLVLVLSITNIVNAKSQLASMNVEVINNLQTAGTVSVYGAQYLDTIYGPILEKNQEKSWVLSPRDELYSVGRLLSGPASEPCIADDGSYVTLDPEQYTGDKIVISYNKMKSEETISCTCSGSACTTSASLRIRQGQIS